MNERKNYYIVRYTANDERVIREAFSTTADVMNDDTKRLQAFCVFGYDFDSYEIEDADSSDDVNEFVDIDEFIDLY